MTTLAISSSSSSSVNPMEEPCTKNVHEWVFNRLPLSQKQKSDILASLCDKRNMLMKEYMRKLDLSKCECVSEIKMAEPAICLKCFYEQNENNEIPCELKTELDLSKCECESYVKVTEPELCLKCFNEQNEIPSELQKELNFVSKSDNPAVIVQPNQ